MIILNQILAQGTSSSSSLYMVVYPTLLSLLPEIRREILTHVLSPAPKLHLYFQHDRPHVSLCLGANLGDETFEERAPSSEFDRVLGHKDGV